MLGGWVDAWLPNCQEDAFWALCCWILPTGLPSTLYQMILYFIHQFFTRYLVRWRSCPFWCFLSPSLYLSFFLLETQTKIRFWHFSSNILRYCHLPTLVGLPAEFQRDANSPELPQVQRRKEDGPHPADTEFSWRLPSSSCAQEVVKVDPQIFVFSHVHSQISLGQRTCFAFSTKRFATIHCGYVLELNCVDASWKLFGMC